MEPVCKLPVLLLQRILPSTFRNAINIWRQSTRQNRHSKQETREDRECVHSSAGDKSLDEDTTKGQSTTSNTGQTEQPMFQYGRRVQGDPWKRCQRTTKNRTRIYRDILKKKVTVEEKAAALEMYFLKING